MKCTKGLCQALFLLSIIVLSSCFLVVSSENNKPNWDCDRPWPDLELFLPVYLKEGGRQSEWRELFVKTFLLFWPVERSKTKLLFLVDEEQRNSTALTHLQQEIKIYPRLQQSARVGFNNPPPEYYGGNGHNRQQFLMFYADNYTTSEYVGFVDTDCFFLTYIDREDIFEHGKPVVNGKSGDPNKRFNRDPLWHSIAATTFEVLGVLEPMKCMAYFPVVVKTKHMRALREYLERKYNMPFYQVFQKYIVSRRYSQFNIFCAYLFHFHQDEYTWYAHDLSPEWDYKNAVHGQENNRSVYTSQMRFPKPRIATHARYHAPPMVGDDHVMYDILQTGICMSPPFPKSYYPCTFYQVEDDFRTEVFEEMHRFEWSDFTSLVHHNDLASIAYARFNRFRHCNHTFEGMNITEVMTHRPRIKDGDFIYTLETGRRIFYYANDTLRGFPNYDTYVAMGGTKKGNTLLTHRQYKNIPKGPDLPPLDSP